MTPWKKTCLAALALGLLLAGCAGRQTPPGQGASGPASAPPAAAVSGSEPAEAASRAPGEAELDETLREWYDADSGRYSDFEVQSAAVVERESWDGCPLIDQALDAGGRTWRNYLAADEGRRLFTAEILAQYTPETAICGPQYSDGIWTVWGVLEPQGSVEAVEYCTVTHITEREDPAGPRARELELTADQWAMAQRQLRALAACGVWRDYTSPADWSAEELARWLAIRIRDWPFTSRDSLEEWDIVLLLQADFSPENGAWGGIDTSLAPAKLAGPVELPADAPDADLFMQDCTVDWSREGDELVARLTAVLTGQTVRMEYRFGLVPEDTGPVSRTWLKQARLLEE